MAAFYEMSHTEAKQFTDRWLPAWTGNDPERLIAFYTDDATYSDPAVPAGIRGRAAVLAYFRRLLARYPDWVWTNTMTDLTDLALGWRAGRSGRGKQPL